MGSILFEDTPAWESGLRSHEAENKWLRTEIEAVLTGARSYTRSLTPSGAFGGTGLGALVRGGGEGMGGTAADIVGGMLAMAGMESFAASTPALTDFQSLTEPQTLNPYTLYENHKPFTISPDPCTLNLKPPSISPKPYGIKHKP